MDDDYVVEIDKKVKTKTPVQIFDEEFSEAQVEAQLDEDELAKVSAQKTLEEAETKAETLLDNANKEADEILKKAKSEAEKILKQAQTEAQENAQKSVDEIISKAKAEFDDKTEKERVETINNAYKEGYEDGHKKLLEELDEKIKFFDEFCKTQYTIEQNILKAASKEILDLILTISKKVLLKELDSAALEKIIESSINLLENKENINIILSEKYAKILYEYQKRSLNTDIDFDFKDFKQYKNFNIIYSPEYSDDTIIVESIKERLDASIASQMEILIRNIEEKTQQEKLEIEEYKRIHEIN